MASIFRYLAAVAALVCMAVPVLAAEAHLAGSASLRQRAAIPANAVLDVLLEDVSRPDVPARTLGETRRTDPGASPIAFDIAYDPSAIRPEGTYSVRAQVLLDGRLIFASNPLNPVLTHGAPTEARLWLAQVGEPPARRGGGPADAAPEGLRLPASFEGQLPCADCKMVRVRLNLWPDKVFHLRRVWEGNGTRRDSIGRWWVDPNSRIVHLRGDDEELQLEILAPDRLRFLAKTPQAPVGKTDYVLTAAPTLHAFEPHLPLRGMVTWVGKEAKFTECLTGREYPILEDGDYEALEHAYLAAGTETGAALMASFDGGILQEPTPEGVRSEVLVERFVGVWPGETCERAASAATLVDTYWKILRLGTTEIMPQEGRREPSLILRAGEPRFSATVGCDPLTGSFTQNGGRLAFRPGATTPAACPKPLDAWERQLADALARTARWNIEGQSLELLDQRGKVVALLQAMYLY